MFELTAANWGWVVCAALLLGTTKMGVAGLSMIAIPIMVMVFGARASTGVMLPLLICGDILAVSYYHRHADWKILVRMLPIAMTGVVGGFFLLRVVTNEQLTFFMGSIILGLIVVTMLRDRGVIPEERIPTGIGFAVVMGLTAGVMTMMANAAGPVMAVYLLSMKLPKNRFIGTSSWFFIVLNVFKVPFSAKLNLITRDSLMFDLKVIPCILLGAVVGILIVKRLSNKKYVMWVQIAAAAGALKLILS
ncbi:MAG: sulfite exporter TauE/SafE family protein [Lentisphaeria bacterium]|nr:sulfite exporter TauE/SafE family protein [Lentisphaeria bacterium]